MTQQDRDLLSLDLSARLTYGVKVFIQDITGKYSTITERTCDTYVLQFLRNKNILIKPYLRPMSSMTEEEKLHIELTYGFFYHDRVLDNVHIFEAGGTYDRDGNYEPLCEYRQEKHVTIEQVIDFIHWLNTNHFDYRGLIEKGLALEAPEGMYNLKE